jgi:diguanylate cyclase (GGDEF)-like protein
MLARGRREHSATAALFVDLDGFKAVNDTLGHLIGDQVLRQVADRLKATLRSVDTIGRLGGDEFVVLVECGTLDVGIDVVAERLIEVLREPLDIAGRERPIVIGASIGIAVGDRASAADLLRDADMALYRAKAAGKGCHVLFAPEMQAEMMARAEIGERFTDAIVDGEFYVACQPTMRC